MSAAGGQLMSQNGLVHYMRLPGRRKITGAEIVRHTRAARYALARVTELAQARQRTVERVVGGTTVPDKEPMTPEDRVQALNTALVWLQTAEDEIRVARIQIAKTRDRFLQEEIY